MQASDLSTLRGLVPPPGILFSFFGYLSESVLFGLGETLKHKMSLDETDAAVSRRVFSVFVEQVQNVIRYSSDKIELPPPTTQRLGSGLVAVGCEDGRWFVVCGNPVLAQDAPRLRERLEHLASLDRDGLRAYYRQRLREPPEADSLGASVGLIEIARRASAPLEYQFFDLEDEGACFYCIKAFI